MSRDCCAEHRNSLSAGRRAVGDLRLEYCEPLAPGRRREASIETDHFERGRIMIGSDQRRRKLQAICRSKRMHA